MVWDQVQEDVVEILMVFDSGGVLKPFDFAKILKTKDLTLFMKEIAKKSLKITLDFNKNHLAEFY